MLCSNVIAAIKFSYMDSLANIFSLYYHQKFFHFCENGNTTLVLGELSKPYIKVNKKDVKGKTGLHYAAENGQLEVCRVLLSKGANIDSKDYKNRRPIDIAKGLDVINLLLHSKKDDRVSLAMFFVAVREGNVVEFENRLSIHGKSMLKAQDSNGRTALHIACTEGSNLHFHITERLLLYGAKINVRDKNGNTPRDIVLAYGNKAIMSLLIQHAIMRQKIRMENYEEEPKADICFVQYQDLFI